MDKVSVKDYVTKVIPKAENVKKMIYNAIKGNTLFKACCEEELLNIIDAFESADFKKGDVVIKQGDEGEHFYVVEEGTLDITVQMDNESSEMHVGVPYMPGAAFGELALMYGSPRAATIRAKEDCKLWCIDRKAFRGITGQHKLKQAEKQVEFLNRVKIGDKVLGDVLKSSDIHAMSLALQKDTFRKGHVIVREGERGDIFYLIESGSVDVLKKDHGDRPLTTLTTGQFFGERALLTEDVRNATCLATSEVQCLYLMREDFNLMLGDLQDLLDGKVRNEDESEVKSKDSQEVKDGVEDKIELKDLNILGTLGIGAFGQVKLVQMKSQTEVSVDGEGDEGKEKPEESTPKPPQKTYALKMLSKSSIVDNGLQDHVLTEKKIMEEVSHPFILEYFGAMQDDKHIYFLLEVLLGGELFKFLRAETQFPESWSRHYSASVLLAFRHLHSKKIAYRDLKPENLVLDKNGFLKLVDFGLAKKIESGKTWTLCGTPDYLAPEVILNEGHDIGVDYWALGVLIYEMTSGAPPFYSDDPMEVYEKILSGHLSIPSHFSRGLGDLIKRLLRTYQSKRLGRTKGGVSSVMKHKWYVGFDWEALLEKSLAPPILPSLRGDLDTSNFDVYDDGEHFEARVVSWNPEGV